MLGFTQEELAELMCVTPVQISHYENDKNDIKVSVLRELARCLRVSTTYLLDGEIECFDKDVMQIAIVLQGIESEELRNVALEQLKVLVRVADLRNLRNRYKQIIWESLPIKSKTNKIEKIAAFYSQVVEQQKEEK